MSIIVTRRDPEIPADIVAYAQAKAEKMFDEFQRVEHIHVILDSQNFLHKAEFDVQAKDHVRIEADQTNEDWKMAIDDARRKATRQLRNSRDKLTDHRSRVRTADFEQQVTAEQED